MLLFNGLNLTQTTTATREIAHARDLAMSAVHSKVLSAMAAPGGSRDCSYGIWPAVARLLYGAFCISPA